MSDLIDRQVAIDELMAFKEAHKADRFTGDFLHWTGVRAMLENLPSAQPEPLTDKEQRIFLAAMEREKKVCKQVDAECRDCREPYEDSLVSTCREIIRKVKGALWT